jgi:hypothetical protein
MSLRLRSRLLSGFLGIAALLMISVEKSDSIKKIDHKG